MQWRRKILSCFLFGLYLLTVLHQSISHTHSSEINDTSSVSHHHEDFETVHHEHHFHIGIFHFLGHLFENIGHHHDLADKYLIFSPKTDSKKWLDQDKPDYFYLNHRALIVFVVDAESLSDPPGQLLLPQKLKQPNTPSRAPPAVI